MASRNSNGKWNADQGTHLKVQLPGFGQKIKCCKNKAQINPHLGFQASGRMTHCKPLSALAKISTLWIWGCSEYETCCWTLLNLIIPDIVSLLYVPSGIAPVCFFFLSWSLMYWWKTIQCKSRMWNAMCFDGGNGDFCSLHITTTDMLVAGISSFLWVIINFQRSSYLSLIYLLFCLSLFLLNLSYLAKTFEKDDSFHQYMIFSFHRNDLSHEKKWTDMFLK